MPRRRRSVQPDHDEADHINDLLVASGLIVPMHEDLVAQAEAEIAEALPESLTDPARVFSDSPAILRLAISPVEDADIDATLARAAREGGRLTPEIEAAMHRDRRLAEERADDATPDR